MQPEEGSGYWTVNVGNESGIRFIVEIMDDGSFEARGYQGDGMGTAPTPGKTRG